MKDKYFLERYNEVLEKVGFIIKKIITVNLYVIKNI